MKRVILTILSLCVLCVGLRAQNTNTTNTPGVTSHGKLDTLPNIRLLSNLPPDTVIVTSDTLTDTLLVPVPIPDPTTNFVDEHGVMGDRPGLSTYGRRLNATVRIVADSVDQNSITNISAAILATVADSGDYVLPILERGVCFDTAANPTLITGRYDPDNTISGDGFGPFEVVIVGLEPDKTYHARAYAIFQGDTVYGKDLVFNTEEVKGVAPSFVNREEGLTVILTKLKNVSKIQWQNKGTEEDVSPNDTMLTHTYEEPNVYKITASNEDGDKFSIYITVPNCGGYLTPLYNESYSEESDGYAISEVRDHQGNNYHVAKIGSQCWMAENLRAKTVPSTGHNIWWGNAWCQSYSSKASRSSNDDLFGYLYNWCAALDTANPNINQEVLNCDLYDVNATLWDCTISGTRRGICPFGWHLPSKAEWETLMGYLSSQSHRRIRRSRI